jgi:CubicO group peptidase (beta-lactamase class C family)
MTQRTTMGYWLWMMLTSLVLPVRPTSAEPLRVVASPERVGLSAERLGRLDRAMQEEVDQKRRPGIVILVARHGQVVDLEAFGMADIESGRRMQVDSIMRLYSMTKPVTSVALLTLYEQGKFQLNDPLEKYLPEFANVKVLSGVDAQGVMLLEPPKRKITILDVFRHTAGFGYGVPGYAPEPLTESYEAAGVSYPQAGSLDELVRRLARQPLIYQPGERWIYSFSHDVLAALVERLAGMPFDVYCRKVIFEPLGMKDTFFGLSAEKAHRYVTLYALDGGGRRIPVETGDGREVTASVDDTTLGFDLSLVFYHGRANVFGGIGLSSSAPDYFRFAQMLLNGGEYHGVRILGRKTVELMTSDSLPQGVSLPDNLSGGKGQVYGLGVGVMAAPTVRGNLGSAGEFGWSGAATTRMVVDPKEDLVLLVFSQMIPLDNYFLERAETLLYQSLE